MRMLGMLAANSVYIEQKAEIHEEQREQQKHIEPGWQKKCPDKLQADERENDSFYQMSNSPPPTFHMRITSYSTCYESGKTGYD
ncbi:cytochrome P450 [Paenibacillus popilliae ATCC 14706]|uniref:Cytochrome P450 n=1 Tax=Paenibacillus popilliae ATCC 14706 TaxID=1212764 RepID=M9LMK0_PAEPP|nr:cytochrome P450 [Paenibacillus popilliae ATCC 14706]